MAFPSFIAITRLIVAVGLCAITHSTPVSAQELTWVKVPAPDGGVMEAAVARPAGKGPFPAVIILHGTHGFQQEYVDVARSMARAGIVGVAACWFEEGRGVSNLRFVHPLHCADGPKMPDSAGPEAARSVGALVQAVRAMPDVRGDRLALFGHSRGAGAALHYFLQNASTLQALVFNSGGYPPDVTARASTISIPILILHGAEDTPANGGTPGTDVQLARDFEAALRRSGKTVEAKYYDAAGHSHFFIDPAQRDDEIRRAIEFLHRHLDK